MIYNQFFFLQQSIDIIELNIITSLAMSNVDVAKKALEFLEKLEVLLKDLDFSESKEYELRERKVCFFNHDLKKYRYYDYFAFNKIFNQLYGSEIVKKRILHNEFYFRLNLIINMALKYNDFNFYKGYFNTYHFISWFFRSLRNSQIEINVFDINKMKNNFPMKFLEKANCTDVNALQHLEFIIFFLQDLEKKQIISIDENSLFKFVEETDISESQRFETKTNKSLTFGKSDKFFFKKTKFELDIDFIIDSKDSTTSVVNDFIFNYILASMTDYVTFDNHSNNIYIDFSVSDLKKK